MAKENRCAGLKVVSGVRMVRIGSAVTGVARTRSGQYRKMRDGAEGTAGVGGFVGSVRVQDLGRAGE